MKTEHAASQIHETWDEFSARMEMIFEAAYERVPEFSDWGYCFYGDAPAGIGGGVSGFAWFSSQEDMYQAVAEYQTWVCPGPVANDQDAVDAQVKAIMRSLQAGEVDGEKAREQLNAALRGYSQIEWWGTYGDLVRGESEFARQARASFRLTVSDQGSTDEDDPAIQQPLREDEQAEFSEWLGTYGL